MPIQKQGRVSKRERELDEALGKRGPGRPRKTDEVPKLRKSRIYRVGMIPARDKPPTGEEVCIWIEKHCYVPEGKLFGQKIVLAPWQRAEILRIYDNKVGTRRAILSFGRKNGKTSLAAMLVLVHLAGPAYVPNGQLYSTAQSRDQAALIYNLAAQMVRISDHLRARVAIRETKKELLCLEYGTRYRALSAEAITSYGLSPAFIVHDELGQVRGPRSALYDALETAVGAQENPLSIIISTQASTDDDLLSILIDDALAGHDPHTIIKLFTAEPELDPFDLETIKLANPAMGNFLSVERAMEMAKDAKRMPSREAEYRNLILNQRVDTSTPFIEPALWKACGGPVDVAGLRTVQCFAGLDLSETRDLTALVIIGRIDKTWNVLPTFWLPEEGLEDKSIADRVPYDLWAKQGHLKTTPGKSIAYEFVANHLRRLFEMYDIRKLAFDRWNFKHLIPWLIKAGFSEDFIADHFVEFGQGMQSMSPALRDLEQALLDGAVAHGNHPVLTSCVANTTIVTDDAGNRKASKSKSVGRIDGLVALAMAIGVAPLDPYEVDLGSLIG